MALKIVGRSSQDMRVRETRQGLQEARELAVRCKECGKLGFVHLPYQPTQIERHRLIQGALDEHRKNCSAKPPEEGRVFEIISPRG